MFQKYKRKIIYSVVLGALVFLALSVYANIDDLLQAFSQFIWYLFPFLLVFSFCNYTARFLKWDYYTRVLDIEVGKKMSYVIFLSSFIMAVTPGKIGEVFKSYLLKEQTGTPISRSAPIIIAERITDFLSLILLSVIGAVTFNYGKGLIITIGILFILIILLISSKRLSYSIIGLFEKFRYFSNISHKIHTAYDSIYRMVRIKELLIAIILSIFAWFFECLGFYVVINGFSIENSVHIDIFVATFIYGFATIAGAVTMLPGGLGATDASIAGFLVILSIPRGVAVASTLLIRVATLWFAVIVGIVAIMYYQRISHKKLSELALDL